MKFIDEATIIVQSGDGGAGCVSFRRERFIPKGGPDGGDGGHGGDVIFKACAGKRTLFDLRTRKHFRAKNGTAGQGSRKTGRSGSDLVIELPPGALLSDPETGRLIKDLVDPDETFVIAKGGIGGLGNARFKSSKNRTPRYAQPGEPGQTLTVKIDLKLIADVGIIGMPNAGKSTLISVMSSAKPKIGNYPFTTLTPNLGVVQTSWGEPFVAADIPGLIEGAHEGAGLGSRFLRHIERTRILVHLVDASEIDPDDPLKAYKTIKKELERYSGKLAQKPQILALNKMDLPGMESLAKQFEDAIRPLNVLRISAAAAKGLDTLKSEVVKSLERLKENAVEPETKEQTGP